MKLFATSAAVLLSITPFATAAPVCVSGTLASYEALGAQGCMIGTNTVFSFETFTGLTGSTPISPMDFTLNPSGGSKSPTLRVDFNQTVASGEIIDSLFGYEIRGNSYTSDSIAFTRSSSTGNGAATDIQNYCPGGTFGPDGVSGCASSSTGDLIVFGNGNDSTPLLPAVQLLAVTDDVTLDSGGSGSASGGRIVDSFGAVPEPSTYTLAAIGIALVALSRLKLRLSVSTLNKEKNQTCAN